MDTFFVELTDEERKNLFSFLKRKTNEKTNENEERPSKKKRILYKKVDLELKKKILQKVKENLEKSRKRPKKKNY